MITTRPGGEPKSSDTKWESGKKEATLQFPERNPGEGDPFRNWSRARVGEEGSGLGTCHINGKFGQRTIELIVSTHLAGLLLLFNTRDLMSYTDIQTILNVTDEDLVRLLLSLSCAKYKILIKDPNTKTFSKNDVFEFNSKFNVGMRRVKTPLPRADERKKVVEDVVEKDRRYAIDAAIVRIMKGSKVLGYQQLVSECVEKLSRMFKPDIKAIKKRIEDLINRDYLERDKENPNMFRYLA
ncbi:unnamed protein product [Microthlaspi erraticum]|uniref:Cullin neddylation domain-containing protein n=1 Tax=Microthlaspi erraticum TaxID=1685480 RepID=A0A6D2JHU0_9BRAS|nr:unnamed protein product [Microthlaspi erraticum]